jgi:hypothetical protein
LYSWRVPLTTFGDLRIVASARIGGAGPFEGQPVFFHWPWHWHLPRLGPWVLLALAIALPRRNRHYEALLIFVPMLVVGLLWQTVTRTAGLPSDMAMQFSFLIEFLMVGMALLWLYADRLGRCGGLIRFVGSLGLVLLAGLVVVFSYGRTLAGAQGVILVFSTTALTMVLLVSLLLTRRLTRRRYRPLAFMVWLVAWCLLFSLAAVAAPAAVRMLAYPSRISDLGYIVSEIITPALVLGLGVYVINLPCMLLMFSSPFFRRRFQAWLGVEPLLAQVQAANSERLRSGRNE